MPKLKRKHPYMRYFHLFEIQFLSKMDPRPTCFPFSPSPATDSPIELIPVYVTQFDFGGPQESEMSDFIFK